MRAFVARKSETNSNPKKGKFKTPGHIDHVVHNNFPLAVTESKDGLVSKPPLQEPEHHRLFTFSPVIGADQDGINRQPMVFPEPDRVTQHAPDQIPLGLGLMFGVDQDEAPMALESLRLSPTNALAFARFTRRFAEENPTNSPAVLAVLDWNSRRALTGAPDHPEAWWARAIYLERVGQPRAAFDLMECASRDVETEPRF